MLIDSHAHLSAPPLIDHAEEILQRAQQAHISAIVNICTDESSLEKGLILSQRHPWVYNAAAVTPHDAATHQNFLPLIRKHVSKLVAIGETGLDYYYEHSPKEKQLESLLTHFALAHDAKLPVVFHCRHAFDDLFAMADRQLKETPAVLHCFTGTLAEAKKCLERGWLVSLSGIVTFKKSVELQEVARFLPLDQMLIETDAPYLAPQSKRGKLNEPAYIAETARFIASLRGITVEELGAATSTNASIFFSFPKRSI
ncbi:MAG: TatD family hydrolase [Verrucomicrobia bacterium]|nr:TatD family hydrolase [Verrucomicrobiota bacterium]